MTLLGAATFAPPAHGQSSTFQQHHEIVRTNIGFLTSEDRFNIAEIGSTTFDLPTGLLPYTQAWQGEFLDSSHGVRPSVREAVDGFATRCFQVVQEMEKIDEMAGTYLELSGSEHVSSETKSSIEDEMAKFSGFTSLMVRKMPFVITAGNTCGRALMNMYMGLRDASAHCTANELAEPQNDPDGPPPSGTAEGICGDRNFSRLNFGSSEACSGSGCELTYETEFFDYDADGTRTRLENIQEDVAEFEETFGELNGQAESQIEAAEQAAATEKEAADAAARSETERGSVVSLSLPFSGIPPAAVIGRIISQILGIVGALALGGFVYGGVLYMTAAGNQERIAKGKAVAVWSILGLVVIFAAYAIVNFLITSLTG